MVGILGAAVVSYIRGPLAASVRVTRHNAAETSLSMGMQLAAVASATRQANNGDCDGDGYIEPIPYRSAGAAPHPTGGGLIPLTIGAAKADPWQRDFGYCTFDHGPTVDDAACGGAGQARQRGANSGILPALALVSAGPNGEFETVCNDYADANLDNIPDAPLVATPLGSDDIAYSWTYAEAAGASDGLWKLEAGDPSTAEIDRNLSVKDGGGVEQFSFDAATGALALGAGGSGAFPTVKADFLDALTAPAIEVLAPINATAPLAMNGTDIIDASGLIVHGEQDPQIATVEDGKFCTGNASGSVTCQSAAPSGAIGTVEDGKWCKGNTGGIITCQENPPSGGGGGGGGSTKITLSGLNTANWTPTAGIERFTLTLRKVSLNSLGGFRFLIGCSTVSAGGYNGVMKTFAASITGANISGGAPMFGNLAAADTVSGEITFALADAPANVWVMTGQIGYENAATTQTVNADLALACPLDRIRLVTQSPPAMVFDNGVATLRW